MNFINALQVYNVNSTKIRIGNKNDGGYIINELISQNTNRLVSIGIGGEDTFERDWARTFPNTIIEMYDGTYPCNHICQEFNDRINQNIFYYQNNVGNEINQIKLFNILNKPIPTLLKIDIEGGEYNIFNNLFLENNIIGLIIEIHDLHYPEYRKKMIELLKNNFKNMLLFHVHGNSWGGYFDLAITETDPPIVVKNFPHVLELSFINKNIVNNYSIDNSRFPINELDTSNRQDQPDIDLYWINQI